MSRTWTASDPRWQALTPYQKAAAMALMEADGARPDDARNVLGAIVNRAQKERADIGQHVSQPIYQPAIEPAQQARLPRILAMPAFQDLTTLAERRATGQEPDWVQGATHFLAPEKTMLALEAREPSKYKNWGPRGQNWTGYDEATGSYRGVVMRDNSHAFLIPGADTPPTSPAPPPAPSVAMASNLTAGDPPAVPATSIAEAPQKPASAPQAGLLAGLFGGESPAGFDIGAAEGNSASSPTDYMPAEQSARISYVQPLKLQPRARLALARAAARRG